MPERIASDMISRRTIELTACKALNISPITVTAASDSKKYDGTPLTNNGFSCTEGVLVPGDVLTAVVEGSATNVGDEGKNVVKSYKVMRGGADVTGNYTFTNSVDGKLTILPRTVTLTSETASKEYDGAPLTRPDVSVTGDGFVSGEVTGITATGSVTYVSDGTVENTITYTTGAAFREENYDITEIPGQLSITQSSNAIVITTASKSREYNGKKLLDYQTTHTGTLAEGDRLVVEFPADAGLTDVGTKRNEYKSYKVERSDGVDVTALPEYKRAKYIGRVFQDPMMGTAATMQIEENLALAARRGKPRTLRPGITKADREFYKEQLRILDLGLEDRMTTKVGLLSGGQRQALTLLMATLQQPKLLLLDEHTAALDPKTAAKVLEATQRIVEKNHLTTMMITHNMRDAISYGNRLIMMYEGHVVVDVSGEEKKNLTVEQLLNLFSRASGSDEADDKLLLS